MGQEHRRLEVGRSAHRDVNPNMFRETADEELRLLARRDVPGVREYRLETVRKLLDRGVKRQATQLGQPRAIDGWPKTKAAQLLEALLGGHTLVQQEGIKPHLSDAGEVVRGHPRPLRRRGALALEKLLTVCEPVQRIGGAVICS